jgi:spermidine/putrescine transport system permease protein
MHVMFNISYVVIYGGGTAGRLRPAPRGGGDGPRRERVDDVQEVALPLIAPGILAGFLLAFALSVDDFVITYFNAGSEVTFPLFVWGAARVGAPPQVNVIGTAIFVLALAAMTANVLIQSRRKGTA